jgi:hypothetical protein
MTATYLERVLWVVAALATAAMRMRLLPPEGPERPAAAQSMTSQAPVDPPDADSLLEAIASIRDENLFRLERHPMDSTMSETARQPALPQKPVLVVRGLVGGPPWSVVIDGIPGRQSAIVMRLGDTVGGFGFLAVRRDSAVIRGLDTTYVLRAVRP